MIFAADFPQIFPWMIELHIPDSADNTRIINIEATPQITVSNQATYDPCLARWEDDGGMAFNSQPLHYNGLVRVTFNRCKRPREE
jgi:hypothetical protein